MRETKAIGISGVARAGKNFFAEHLMTFLKQRGHSNRDFALAHELKLDLRQLCMDKLGIDTFTQKDEEKNIIRPLLVTWGKIQRNRSNGTYWWKKIDEAMREKYHDFSIVTDIRYDVFEQDEVYFVKDHCKGKLIHISRVVGECPERGILYQPPANQDEAENDPKVKADADLRLEFGDLLKLTEQERKITLDRACEQVLNLYAN